MNHNYQIYLSQNDPLYNQPLKIIKELKPHQKSALFKSINMEQNQYIQYYVPDPENYIHFIDNTPTFKGSFQVSANVGIIGDIVGYGKTLIGLSIIAEASLNSIFINQNQIHSYGISRYSGNLTITKNRTFSVPLNTLINTTLVIVPRGPVYMQWKNTIEIDTTLKYLSIDSLHTIKKVLPKNKEALQIFLESFDLILIKNTTLKVWFDYLTEIEIFIPGFSRILIDEAHDIIYKIPKMDFKYLWLITSSYIDLINYSYSKSISTHVDLLLNKERIHYLLVKSKKSFITQSFNIPEPIELYYLCQMNKNISMLAMIVSPSIRDKINVNDIAGAIHELGGTQETEQSLIESVKKDFIKDIQNKEKEIAYIESLDIDTEQKESRLRNSRNELNRFKTRLDSLSERLNDLTTKTCPICFDTLDNPLYLNCTHTLCGKCLFQMAYNGVQTRNKILLCPECRTPINSSQIRAVVNQLPIQNENIPILLKKEEQLIQIILKKPMGKFLLFSRLDSQFYNLCKLLTQNEISHSEIKGSTQHMMNILHDFNNGKIKVILLNTYHAGCGIDISCATDVIIYHQMPAEKYQAIGRAQRVGRTDTLTIHNLCYPQELQEN